MAFSLIFSLSRKFEYKYFQIKKKRTFLWKIQKYFLATFTTFWALLAWRLFFKNWTLSLFYFMTLYLYARACAHTHTHTHAHKNWLPRRPIKDPYKKTNFSNCSLLQRKTGLRQKTVLLAIYFPALITTTKP